MMKKRFILLALLWTAHHACLAQEGLKPLRSNLSLIYPELRPVSPRTAQNPSLRVQAASLFLPFTEDFFYAPESSVPDPAKWSDSSAFINSGYPISPPSIGVATFDGLNKHGYPYEPNILNNNVSRPADRLTSQPINLQVTASSQTLQPSDSVALSFYYQSTGYGETPELSDSLALDLFAPLQNKWYNAVWYKKRGGTSNLAKGDTTFTRVFIWIDSTKFLQDGFRFRFRNAATTTGNFDHWHVDYIYLDKNRSMKADTVIDDIAFLYVPTPFLRDYSAMPWEQYNANEMAPKAIVKMKNNKPGLPQNMSYGYRVDSAATQLSVYNGFATNINAQSQATYAPHANPPVNYTFNPLGDSADFKVTHFLFQSSSASDFIPKNDTVVYYQRFRNYYALDDGSAEAGYYVSVPQAKMAIKINVNVTDSFLGARIYFDPVGQINQAMSSAGFSICVWGAGANGPGGNIIFRDDSVFQPKYFNVDPAYSFAEFRLKSPIKLSPGTYYIGIQQRSDIMTIGFDRNYDHRTSTYYDSGSGWTQSEIKGSLMIRPVFGKTLPPSVGISDVAKGAKEKILVYPNPASDQVTVSRQGTEPLAYILINAVGQVLATGAVAGNTGQINTALLPAGIYFLVLKNGTQGVQQQKILIQR